MHKHLLHVLLVHVKFSFLVQLQCTRKTCGQQKKMVSAKLCDETSTSFCNMCNSTTLVCVIGTLQMYLIFFITNFFAFKLVKGNNHSFLALEYGLENVRKLLSKTSKFEQMLFLHPPVMSFHYLNCVALENTTSLQLYKY